MAGPIHKHGMNRDEALVEIFADQDSDVSDFKFSVSEESEEKEEEDEGEHDESGKEEDENVCGALQGNHGQEEDVEEKREWKIVPGSQGKSKNNYFRDKINL